MNLARRWTIRPMVVAILATAGVAGAGVNAWAQSARAHSAPGHAAAARGGFTVTVFASAARQRLVHTTPAGRERLSEPDDITALGDDIFVAFQNGVGPQGQASTTGNKDSTVVEFNRSGKALDQWDVVGKCDGLTADAAIDRLIATVNEDANSSIYLIRPVAGAKAVHYRYSEPLPSNGGTDAIEVYDGVILLSASAPGTIGAPAPVRPIRWQDGGKREPSRSPWRRRTRRRRQTSRRPRRAARAPWRFPSGRAPQRSERRRMTTRRAIG